MLLTLTLLSVLAWTYLAFFHGRFWDPILDITSPDPAKWPDVDIIVPARNEADILHRSLPSLLAQDYPGNWRILLINDHSTDGTVEKANEIAEQQCKLDKLTIVNAPDLKEGWVGKVGAMQAGVDQSSSAFVLFTDADIHHHAESLRQLVAVSETKQLDLNSLMVKLNCTSWAEKLMIPAFVFFFAMLYPFRKVNDIRSKVAAAAGGVMLVRREVLDEAGGLEKIKGEIIDDCSLAKLIKGCSDRIRLSLTYDVHSLRPYESYSEIHKMIARSAYTQLSYSPLRLVLSVLGMLILFIVPLFSLIYGSFLTVFLGLAIFYEIFILYRPMTRFYGRSRGWSATLPIAALFFIVATIDSAINYWKGKGGMWKGRAQAS